MPTFYGSSTDTLLGIAYGQSLLIKQLLTHFIVKIFFPREDLQPQRSVCRIGGGLETLAGGVPRTQGELFFASACPPIVFSNVVMICSYDLTRQRP